MSLYALRAHQLPWFAAFVTLMAIDASITIWGALYYNAFQEANPLFSSLLNSPSLFISAIIFSKIVAIAVVYGIILYLNSLKESWGDAGCMVAAGTIAIALSGMIVYNLLMFL